jgi:hypothetical protein
MKKLIFALIITCVAIFLTRPTSADSIKKIYWTDNESKKIYRANLDGSDIEVLVDGDGWLDCPWNIALDSSDGKMCWTNPGHSRIRRANLDGSSIEELPITLEWEDISSIELDVNDGKIYWTCLYVVEYELSDNYRIKLFFGGYKND